MVNYYIQTLQMLRSFIDAPSFLLNWFTQLGNDQATNQNLITYIAYQTLYTHIKWGVTSQGKFQIEAYNPVTNEGMIYYIGSGVAGHQISHSMGVEIDYSDGKNLRWLYTDMDTRHLVNSYVSTTVNLTTLSVQAKPSNVMEKDSIVMARG
jgi:hypothetical protein